MQVSAMSCNACGVKVEGPYTESALNRLLPDDQQFLLDYLLSGFSIKALEEKTNLGYAAIRTRLDKLIANTKSVMRAEEQKKAILEKRRSREITVAEAKRKLEKL
jgi:hypothetical protein